MDFVMPYVVFNFTLQALEDTELFGQALGRALARGEHLALVGGLGAGKTTLTRAVAEGFGVSNLAEVASPTYAYAHEYAAQGAKLQHLDFYRLGDADNALALGIDEVLQNAEAPAVVEWADLVPELLSPEALWLTLTRAPGASARAVVLRVPAARASALQRALAAWVGTAVPERGGKPL